jgi:hypothetical protein
MGISGFPKTEFGKLDIRRLDYENWNYPTKSPQTTQVRQKIENTCQLGGWQEIAKFGQFHWNFKTKPKTAISQAKHYPPPYKNSELGIVDTLTNSIREILASSTRNF